MENSWTKDGRAKGKDRNTEGGRWTKTNGGQGMKNREKRKK